MHTIVHYYAPMSSEPGFESSQIGADVRRRRQQRGWTLDETAARLGVSRRLLAQLEAGQANPSLSTLLAIATGFDTSLAELIAGADKPSIVVQPDNSTAPRLWEGAHGGEARLLAGSEPLELWEWSLEPGDERAADAHRPNSREILSVTKGQVTLTVGAEEPVVLKAGQSALFCADKPHSYRNASTRRCEFLLAVHEPNGVPS